MKKIVFFILIISSHLMAVVAGDNTRNFTVKQVKEDMKAQDYEKYTRDNFPTLTSEALIERGIINGADQLINLADVSAEGDFLKAADCSFVNTPWTATIYDFNVREGVITCMVAPMGDLNNPIGKFDVSYEKAKIYFSINKEKAKEYNEQYMLNAESKFASIKDEKERIFRSVGDHNRYISTTDLILAVILTDTNIIDLEQTKLTGSIQLKDGLTSKVFDDKNNIDTYTDHSSYILLGLESMFISYIKLSDVAMNIFIYIVTFLGIYGIGSKLISYFKKEKGDYIVWTGSVFIGLLLFAPISNDHDLDGYNLFQTKFQDFQISGFSLFDTWADNEAAVIIDTELESIINRSGVGTVKEIINSYSAITLFKKQKEESDLYNKACAEVYNKDNMYQYDSGVKTKFLYSDNSQTVFPTSENWGYAMALNNRFSTYYSSLPIVDVAYSNDTRTKFNSLDEETKMKREINEMFYPQLSLSSCGKSFYTHKNSVIKHDKAKAAYDDAIGVDGDSDKIEAIRELVKFQYELQRDFQFLSVLGLPITKLQTEMIGNLYNKSDANEHVDKLKEQMTSGDEGQEILHSIVSSVPYMFVPMAGSVFNHTIQSARDMKASYSSSGAGMFTNFFGGGIAASAAANTVGFGLGLMVAKTVLAILPMLGLLTIGLLRFIVIIIKITLLHFGALFLLPFAFMKNNINVITSYTVKTFATMMELPIFVLSVWLAMSISPLLQSLSSLLTTLFVNQMLVNNELQHKAAEFTWHNIINLNFAATDTIKIYFISGFFEVLFSLASVFVIYKIIVTAHTALFEMFEVKATSSIDSMVDSIRQDNMSFGNKV